MIELCEQVKLNGQKVIDDFREDKDCNALVAQIETLGQGLNTQFVNVIIFCESQIKLSLETQAVARAHWMDSNSVFLFIDY